MHRLGSKARADLDDIWQYVARESGNVDNSDRLIDFSARRFLLLAEHPRLGKARDDDLGPGRRSFPVGDTVIIYRVVGMGTLSNRGGDLSDDRGTPMAALNMCSPSARRDAILLVMMDTPTRTPSEPDPPPYASGDEAAVLREIIRNVGHLPDGIQRVEFHFGEDSEGAPAVWITFVAQDDLKPSKAKMAELRRVMHDVRSKVIQSGTGRWPFLEITTE